MFKVNTVVPNFVIGCFIQTADGAEKTTGVPTGTFVADGTPGALTGSASYDAVGKCWVWSSVQAAAMNGAIVGLVFNLAACLPIVFVIRTSTKLVSDLQDIAAGAAMTLTGAYDAAKAAAQAGALATVDDLVDDLETRLTALRAGYLDNLSAGAVATAAALTAVAANVTTLLARIGAFTGTGVNTILGFLKAVMSKAASTPSDVGGTFSAATDSLEALQETFSVTLSSGTTDVTTGSTITRTRGDTWSIPITITGDVADLSKIYFTLKKDKGMTDAEATLFIEKTAGLTVVNGAAYATVANGSITVAGQLVTMAVKAAVTKDLDPRTYYWDIEEIDAGGVHTHGSGVMVVEADVTRAVS